jgi:aminopeptidase
MTPTQYDELLFRYASDVVLDTPSDLTAAMLEHIDVRIRIASQGNTRAMTNVDASNVVRMRRAQQPLMMRFRERAAAGDLLWCTTMYPCPAYAQDAEMSEREFAEFLFQAGFLNEEDPVACWQRFAERQQALADALADAREVQIRAPGTDLRLGVSGRTWGNDQGKENYPGGEVFTGPVEDQVEGQISFNMPSVHSGREVNGVRLWFEGGRVVRAEAAHNEAYLLQTLDTDPGARIVGELAFGTNSRIQRYMRNTLFDEKIGGTIHLALGFSYPETGGKNVSSVHWDMVCDLRREGEVWVDGELFQENGRFSVLDGGLV